MQKRIITAIAVLGVIAAMSIHANTVQAANNGQLMFILDASSSMLAKDEGSTMRIDRAKTALKSTLDSLPADTQVGLRVYGSEVPDTDQAAGCQDTVRLNAPKANNVAAIKTSVDAIQAKGWTLMGKSLQEVAGDFTGEGPKSVILLSDGIDTCETPNACEVAKSLQSRGVRVKINTLGLLVDDAARQQLSCIAENSGGTYFDINDLNKLGSTVSALTQREVSLFTLKGVPIAGTLRPEDAPVMLADTNYTDTILFPQERYYAFDLLAKQKVDFTLKTSVRDTPFAQNTYNTRIVADIMRQDTLESLQTYPREEFLKANGDMTPLQIDQDAAYQTTLLAKPTRVVYKVSFYLTDEQGKAALTGAALPFEMKVTTEGGVLPAHKTPSDSKSVSVNSAKDKPVSTLKVVVLAVLGTLIILCLAYVLWRIAKRRRANSVQNNSPLSTVSTKQPAQSNDPDRTPPQQ